MGWLTRLFGREDASWQASSPVGSADVKNVVLTGDDARQAMQAIETATGTDLDGDGRAGSLAPAALASGPADFVSQLERLAKLRDSGALTSEEFEREKAKLLA